MKPKNNYADTQRTKIHIQTTLTTYPDNTVNVYPDFFFFNTSLVFAIKTSYWVSYETDVEENPPRLANVGEDGHFRGK